jgi:hypothetical protein
MASMGLAAMSKIRLVQLMLTLMFVDPTGVGSSSSSFKFNAVTGEKNSRDQSLILHEEIVT